MGLKFFVTLYTSTLCLASCNNSRSQALDASSGDSTSVRFSLHASGETIAKYAAQDGKKAGICFVKADASLIVANASKKAASAGTSGESHVFNVTASEGEGFANAEGTYKEETSAEKKSFSFSCEGAKNRKLEIICDNWTIVDEARKGKVVALCAFDLVTYVASLQKKPEVVEPVEILPQANPVDVLQSAPPSN